MNHYCTYFDRSFLIQGVALWRSLAQHDVDAVLWVLALDEDTGAALREVGGTWIRVVPLAELEANDPALAAAKAGRTRVEYYFTLSPCWPRWLLANRPEIERVTYVDADLLFFASPGPVFEAMDAARASVLMTAHRFGAVLHHYGRHGKYNVGILSFRNDSAGRAVLDDWRSRCLAWCHDRLEDGKYADQKYLDDWPGRFGKAVLVLEHPGVNLAPWNWAGHRCEVREAKIPVAMRDFEEKFPAEVFVDGQPLVLFHFARFRPLAGTWWWQSGQLDYGVMPRKLRHALYGAYWRSLVAARTELAAWRLGFDFIPRVVRFDRSFWRGLPPRLIFGSDWLRWGTRFFSARFGLGHWSGHFLAKLRTIFFRP